MSGAGITTEDKNVILKAYSTQRVGSGSSFESGNQVFTADGKYKLTRPHGIFS